MTQARGPAPRRPIFALAKIALVVGALVAVNHLFSGVLTALDIDIRPSNEGTVHKMIMTVAAVYTVALAIPFVPGVEIGLGLMAVLGVGIVPLVYLCTVAGLTLAFLAGRLVPFGALIRVAGDLRLRRLAALLARYDRAPPDRKLDFLLSASQGRWTALLLRHRYVALALLINLPGNFVIGGGGGIALLAGASRLFAPPLYLLTVAIAVSPVPLLILTFGPSVLAP